MITQAKFEYSSATFLFCLVCIGILGLVFILVGCQHTEPMEAPPDFVGEWAGEFTDGTETFLLTLSIREDRTYTATIQHGADTLSRERGKWDATKTIFRTMAQTCEEGAPPHLISCAEDWESIPIDIAGGAWTMHFAAGGNLQSVTLRRVG